MTGQNLTNIEEVMILVRMRDGREHGWVVNSPSYVSWEHTGMLNGSATAKVSIGSGEFYRKSKSPASRAIEDQLNERLRAVDYIPPKNLEQPGDD